MHISLKGIAIKKLNELYQKQGYNLAQVVDVKELSADGTLKLVIAEGLIAGSASPVARGRSAR